MKTRILATTLAIFVFIGPAVCGAFCTSEGAETSPQEPASAAAPADERPHTAACHASPEDAGEAPAVPTGPVRQGPDCCRSTTSLSALGASASESPSRLLGAAAVVPVPVAIVAGPARVVHSEWGRPLPGSPYQRANPPLLI